MNLKIISCEIFYREMCALAARSPNRTDIEFLPKGLHDIGAPGMLARVQAAVDATGGKGYDAILLGYGLCNNGVAGLAARSAPLVIPRAHDCMTLFLGGTARYLEYFYAHPGTYFQTTGWLERGSAGEDLKQLTIEGKNGVGLSRADFV
ncbi:MAG: DUF1638 domain-containing protein, partial [Planctomycetota bacterium]